MQCHGSVLLSRSHKRRQCRNNATPGNKYCYSHSRNNRRKSSTLINTGGVKGMGERIKGMGDKVPGMGW